MKVLVTGGAGFIGSHLVERLVKDGYDVTVIDDLSNSNFRSVPEDAYFIDGDILEQDKLDEAVRYCDCVFHLAAKISVPESIKNPKETMRVNVEGTDAVIKASNEAGVKKIVFASSAAVYGNISLPCKENMQELIPTSPYGESKLIAEQLLNDCRIKTVILRYFNVYGERQKDSVIMRFLSDMRKMENPIIYGDGMRTRDFVNVADVVEANMLAMKIGTSGMFNIGTGNETTIRKLVELINRTIGCDIKPLFTEPRDINDVTRSVANTFHAKKHLGFKAKVSLMNGLKKMVEKYCYSG